MPFASRVKNLKNSKILFLSLFVGVLSGCLAPQPVKDMTRLAQDLDRKGLVTKSSISIGTESLHYVERGLRDDVVLLLLHGTPGRWTIFSSQLSDSLLYENVRLVAIDRPTWGESTVGTLQLEQENKEILTLEEQLDYLEPLLLKLKEKSKKIIVAGHSLGASMAPMLALRYPELVNGVITLAGDLSSELLKPEWYNRIADTWLLTSILPNELTIANKEVLALPKSLELLNTQFTELAVPLLVVHGVEDGLVHIGNVDYAKKLKTQSYVNVKTIPGKGHLFHVDVPAEVNKLIYEFIQKL